jgi:hypothetical protein
MFIVACSHACAEVVFLTNSAGHNHGIVDAALFAPAKRTLRHGNAVTFSTWVRGAWCSS